MGFAGIEFPLRPGFQVEPADAARGLPRLARQLAGYDLRICSVASEPKEEILAACQAAGVPLLRIMLSLDPGQDYLEAEKIWKKQLDQLQPLCRRYQVRIGVQQHCGRGVFSSMELRQVLAGLDPEWIGGIWDAAHSALAGEDPEQALAILWDHLFLLNFKNAYYRQEGVAADGQAIFKPYFVPARAGAANWAKALAYAIKRGYRGDLCMPAEYTDTACLAEHLPADLAYLKKQKAELFS
jgi:sugar phosphate isomerase/epimerase